MGRDQYYLLNYLDQPARFLFFTIDEFIVLLVPLMLGFWMMWALTGALCSFGGFILLRIMKKQAGESNFRQSLYWYLPTSSNQMKIVIPSYIRELIG